jgi:hypothetical protein
MILERTRLVAMKKEAHLCGATERAVIAGSCGLLLVRSRIEQIAIDAAPAGQRHSTTVTGPPALG